MRQRTDVQVFDEAATQLEEALQGESSPANGVMASDSADVLQVCLAKLATLKAAKHKPDLLGPSLYVEISRAIGAIGTDNAPDDTAREALFAKHITTIEVHMETGNADPTDLEEAAHFVRLIAVGIETYRSQLRIHFPPRA